MRRRLYEAVRRRLDGISSPTDIVLLVFSSEVATMSSHEVEALVDTLFESVDTYQESS